jgi:aminoethylphosphonate catabolism LysR family transcriptional regulator
MASIVAGFTGTGRARIFLYAESVMPMNLTHLRAFHSVAAEGSFVPAAARLRVSQPTLSEQVRALERGYGVALFDRRGRRIELTPLGERLHEISRRLFDLADEAEQCVSDARHLRTGRLRVGADSPAYAMPLLAAMREQLPGVQATLSTGTAGRVLADLLAHRIDVAYIGNVEPDPRLVAWPLWQTTLVATVHGRHAWARRRRITAAELVGARLVIREPGSMTRRTFERALAGTGLATGEILEVDSREAVLAAAAFGLGVGLVAEDEMTDATRLVRLRVDGLALDLTEYLVCLAERRDLTVVRAACDLARSLA